MPADRAAEVAEKLRSCWESLAKHEKEMASGADKQFCELVKKCVDELWEEVVESGTWLNHWQDTLVWQKIELPPGEAERRIREKVRPWLAEARRLKYKKWGFTQGVDGVGAYVDEWFAGGKDGASANHWFIQDVREHVAQLYRDIQTEGDYVEDWWTYKTRQCREALNDTRKDDAAALDMIRGPVRAGLEWARQRIGDSRYAKNKGIRRDLDKTIELIARGSAQEASKASEAGAVGEASEAGAGGAGGEAGAARRDAQKLGRQKQALAESLAEKNVEIAGLEEEKRRLVAERDALLRVVDNQKRQIAVLERLAGASRAQPGVRVEALLRALGASA
jgi:hypothetical protein